MSADSGARSGQEMPVYRTELASFKRVGETCGKASGALAGIDLFVQHPEIASFI
jgi:hypothetical protein